MKQFYSAMTGTPALRPAAALRAAQIQVSKTKGFEDPYYWAAFTLQGEWR
jgi:CHAT domain-containing protein